MTIASTVVEVGDRPATIDDVVRIADGSALALTRAAVDRIAAGRAVVDSLVNGEELIYGSERPYFDLYRRSADASSPPVALVTGGFDHYPGGVSADVVLPGGVSSGGSGPAAFSRSLVISLTGS